MVPQAGQSLYLPLLPQAEARFQPKWQGDEASGLSSCL